MKAALTFPAVGERLAGRIASCPGCGHPGMWAHWERTRPLIDPQVKVIPVKQFRCPKCQATVSQRPVGVGYRCRQSGRTKAISVTLWGLGLSYQDSSRLMKALGLAISKVGVWNNVQAAGMLAMAKHQGSKKKQLAVLGVDETQFKVKGRGIELAFITDPATGMVVGMELLASREGEELAKLLCEYARRHGAEVVVTDDLASYKPAAESAGVEHQVCLTHVRKAVTNRLKKISGFEVEKEAIRAAIRELTPQAKKDLKRIHLAFVRASPPKKGEQQSPAYMLRMLSLELLENWQRLTCYQRQHKGLDKLGRPIRRDYSVPSTNNATENAIGRAGKIRYRRTRGFKSVPSAMASLAVLASLGGVLCGVSYNHLFS